MKTQLNRHYLSARIWNWDMFLVIKKRNPYQRLWNTAYDDYCIARAAKVLGKEQDYDYFMKRAMNYKRLILRQSICVVVIRKVTGVLLSVPLLIQGPDSTYMAGEI